MNAATRLFVGVAGLVLVFLAINYLYWILLAFAILPILLLVAGQLVIPTGRHQFQVWLDNSSFEGIEEIPSRICGNEITFGFFKKWHEFEVVTKNLIFLAIIGLLSMGATAFVLTAWDSLPSPAYWVSIWSAWMFVVYCAWRWLRERWVMRRSGTAFGSFRMYEDSGRWGLTIVNYSFVDDQHHYRGGSVNTPFASGANDDGTIVFYDPKNPEQSVPAAALLFHRVQWVKPIPIE